MKEPSQLDRMRAIYERVPKVACKRRCQQACGPVFEAGGLTAREYERVTNLVGARPIAPGLVCGYLDRSGLCSVYGMRPLVCRLWGAVDHPQMRCPHGCEPERWLTDEEARALLAEMEQVAGGRVEGDPATVALVQTLAGNWRWSDGP
jgi:Fe-S-cluster containining protein